MGTVIILVITDQAVCSCGPAAGCLLHGGSSPELVHFALKWMRNDHVFQSVYLWSHLSFGRRVKTSDKNFVVGALNFLGNLCISCVLEEYFSETDFCSLLIWYSHLLHLICLCSPPASWRVHLCAHKKWKGLIEICACIILVMNCTLINVSSSWSESWGPLVTQIL